MSDDITTAEQAIETALGEADSSPAEAPPTEESSASEAPETTAAATELSAEPVIPEGFIPNDRHKAVLEKARGEAATIQGQLDKFQSDYGWATQLDPQQVTRALEVYNQVQGDPLNFLQALRREVEADPHLKPQLNRPTDFQMPEPSLVSQDGRPAYDAGQITQILDHQRQTLEAQFAERAMALDQRIQAIDAREAERAQAMEADQRVAQTMAEVRALPGWDEALEAKVAADFRLVPQAEVNTRGLHGTLMALYVKHAMPGVEKKATAAATETMQRKAAASTAQPTASADDAMPRLRTERDLEKFLERQAQG